MAKLLATKGWRIAYRIVMVLAALWSCFMSVGAKMVYAINATYFPHQSHLHDQIWMYVWPLIAITAFCEAAFLIAFRMFTRTI